MSASVRLSHEGDRTTRCHDFVSCLTLRVRVLHGRPSRRGKARSPLDIDPQRCADCYVGSSCNRGRESRPVDHLNECVKFNARKTRKKGKEGV